MAGSLRTRIVGTLHELEQLAGSWSELHRRSGSTNPFLTPEWTLAWVEAGNERPFTVAVSDGDRLVGLLPLVRRGRALRRLSFIEGDAFGLLHEGPVRQVAEACADALDQERASWDAMVLSELLEESADTEPLRAALAARGLSVEGLVTSRYPFVSVAGPLTTYEKQVGKKVINEIRRRQRQLEALAPLRFERVTGEEEVRTRFAALVEQHQRRWLDRSDTSAFTDPTRTEAMLGAALRLARTGRMVLDLLLLDDVLVACCYGMMLGGRHVYYSPSFDPAYAPFSVSKVLLRWQIADCFDHGRTEFDFSRGAEPYKAIWATGERTGSTLVVHHGPRGKAVAAAAMAKLRSTAWLKSSEKLVRLRRVEMGRWRHRLSPGTWANEGRRALHALDRSLTDRGVAGTASRVASRALAPVRTQLASRLYRCALPVELPPLAGATVAALRPAQFDALVDGGRYELADVVRRYYQGHRCLAARVDGGLASYAWEVAGRPVEVPELGETLALGQDEIYIGDCYTLPPYRGRGLYSMLLRWAMAEASRRGAHVAWIVVDESNAASIRGIERSGFVLVRTVARETWFGRGPPSAPKVSG